MYKYVLTWERIHCYGNLRKVKFKCLCCVHIIMLFDKIMVCLKTRRKNIMKYRSSKPKNRWSIFFYQLFVLKLNDFGGITRNVDRPSENLENRRAYYKTANLYKISIWTFWTGQSGCSRGNFREIKTSRFQKVNTVNRSKRRGRTGK